MTSKTTLNLLASNAHFCVCPSPSFSVCQGKKGPACSGLQSPISPTLGLQAGAFSLHPRCTHQRGKSPKVRGVSTQREGWMSTGVGQRTFLWWKRLCRGAWRSALWGSSEGTTLGCEGSRAPRRGLGWQRRGDWCCSGIGLAGLGPSYLCICPVRKEGCEEESWVGPVFSWWLTTEPGPCSSRTCVACYLGHAGG